MRQRPCLSPVIRGLSGSLPTPRGVATFARIWSVSGSFCRCPAAARPLRRRHLYRRVEAVLHKAGGWDSPRFPVTSQAPTGSKHTPPSQHTARIKVARQEIIRISSFEAPLMEEWVRVRLRNPCHEKQFKDVDSLAGQSSIYGLLVVY